MAKWIISIIMALVLVSVAYGIDMCQDKLIPGKQCYLVTPPINCDSYEIYRINGVKVLNGSMTTFNGSMYSIVFNLTKGHYIVKLCDNSTTRELLVEGEDDSGMGALTVMLFIGTMTAILFILGFKLNLKNQIANLIIKRCCILFGLFLLSLDMAMLMTIQDVAGLGLDREMYRWLWLVLMTIRIYGIYLAVATVLDTLKLWKWKKMNKRMGNDE